MSEFLRAKQISQMFNIHVNTVYNWVKQGVLPEGRKMGGCHVWSKEEVLNAFNNAR